MARQPIRRPDGDVLGHEYLYRSAAGRAAGVDRWPTRCQDAASASVLRTLYGPDPGVGTHREARDGGARHARRPHAPVGTGLVFVNVTRAFLVGDLPLPPADRRLVLEVVETVEADADAVDGLARLRGLGYPVALDDWTASPAQRALLPFADYVKIDCRDLDALGTDGLDEARAFGAHLVAERVADTGLRVRCTDLRFDLLQGYALGRPALVGAGA